MNLRQDIQGLRAIAVLLVIAFHINNKWLPGGFIGVDMFFVISGFLISQSILKAVDNDSFNFIIFFEGRLKRIMPNYLFMLLLIVILASFILITTDYQTFFHQFKRAFLFISNQLFATTDDYFGTKSFENPLLHTWSLSIEMQFYFFLPVIIYFLPKSLRIGFISILFIFLLFYTEYKLRIEKNKAEIYFALLARALEFMVGISINFLPQQTSKKHTYKEIYAVFAILIIFVSAMLITEKSIFPGLLGLPSCIATAALILITNSKTNVFLSTPIFSFIGKISYSLYLYHWPVLALYRYSVMRYHLYPLEVFFLIICFSSIAILSYYIVEQNFRKLQGFKFYKLLITLTFLVCCVWFFSPKLNMFLSYVPEQYSNPKFFNNNNHNQYSNYELLGNYNLPDDKILLIGDSHGLGLLPFMNCSGLQNNFNFSAITMNHYPPLPGLNIDKLTNTIDLKVYLKLSGIAENLIKKSKIIILVKYWKGNPDFSEAYNHVYKLMRPDQKLIILSDIPHLAQNPVRKYKSLTKPAKFEKENILIEKFSDEVISFAVGKSNVYFFDIYEAFFFKDAPYYNDTLIYIDESHINPYGSVKLANFKGAEFGALINKLKKGF